MPDGLKYVLAAPGRQRFMTVLENEETSLHHLDYVRELIKNFTEDAIKKTQGDKRVQIHLLLYSFANTLLNPLDESVVSVYDDFEKDIGTIYTDLVTNWKQDPDRTHVLIIEDFALFSVLSANRGCEKLGLFLRKIGNVFQKCYVFANQNALSSKEISKLYEVSSAVAVLRGTSSESHTSMLCDLLKIRDERRLSHEQTKFQVVDREIVEIKEEKMGEQRKNQEEMLKNLTTFKLTLEDKEKETKNRLYLPYFDAQKIEVDESEDLEDYDDEDEEV